MVCIENILPIFFSSIYDRLFIASSINSVSCLRAMLGSCNIIIILMCILAIYVPLSLRNFES